MPSLRYDPGIYVTNGSTPVNHGAPANAAGIVGIAIKQQAPDPTAGLVTPMVIAASEPYYLQDKGEVLVDITGISSPAQGDPVYMVAATNALTKTVGSNLKFGRIVEVAGKRGVPAGKCRIDLDTKDSF